MEDFFHSNSCLLIPLEEVEKLPKLYVFKYNVLAFTFVNGSEILKNNKTKLIFLIISMNLILGNIQTNSTGFETTNSSNLEIDTNHNSPLNRIWNHSIGNAAGTPAIADLENDGVFEIIVGGTNGIFAFNAWGILLWNDSSWGEIEASPVMADVDGDNKMEVFFSTYTNNVVALNAEDGSILWNQTISNTGIIGMSITDLENDGNYELIVNDYGDFYLYDALTGSSHWQVNFVDGTIFQPAIGDIDNDGIKEIILGDGSEIRAIDTNGQMIWNASKGVQSGVALADMNLDRNLDVIVPDLKGYVSVLRGDNGTEIWSSAMVGEALIATPSIGDLDHDGYLEISIGSTYSNTTYVFNHDGTLAWSYHTEAWLASSTSMADIDGDGELELVLTDFDSNIYAFEGNGTLIWTHTPFDASSNDVGSPILFDLDLDGDLELIDVDGFSTKGFSNIVVYDMGETGTKISWFGLRGTSSYNSEMNLANIDADSDTLQDDEELDMGTDPFDPDTDGDGIPDGVEAKQGTDPNDGDSTPNQSDNPENTSDENFFESLPGFNLITSLAALSVVFVLIRFKVRK